MSGSLPDWLARESAAAWWRDWATDILDCRVADHEIVASLATDIAASIARALAEAAKVVRSQCIDASDENPGDVGYNAATNDAAAAIEALTDQGGPRV